MERTLVAAAQPEKFRFSSAKLHKTSWHGAIVELSPWREKRIPPQLDTGNGGPSWTSALVSHRLLEVEKIYLDLLKVFSVVCLVVGNFTKATLLEFRVLRSDV